MNEDLEFEMKGVWIPSEILFNESLSPTEKLLFAEIDALDKLKKGGCFAGNDRLAKLIGIKVRQVQQCISNLKKHGFIKQSSFNGRQRVLNSNLKYVIRGAENCMSAIQENAPLLHIREKIEEKEVVTSSQKPEKAKSAEKYHYLSELLITKIKLSGTQMKIIPEKLIPKWAQDFRLMVEQDKKTENQIENVIEEIFSDSFWSKQVRCASKLREHWNGGKFDRLKDSQNAQEGQRPTKAMTPWQELCRDSGDPGQRVFDKLIRIWEEIEDKEWMNYTFSPSDVKIMEPIFYIMQEFKGRSNVEMIKAVKKNLEGYKYAG
jgi:Txe/YoeB family toxin of Txe-Axe toxin-antitoxin module